MRDSTVDGGGGSQHSDRGHGNGGGEREWYRISFGESMDSEKWGKSTTSCVVTSEMSDGKRGDE